MTLTNSNNAVVNNVIHDCSGAGNYGACVDTCVAGNNTIQNNTIYNSGRYGVLLGVMTDTPNNQVLNNDISRFGYLTQDKGAIYSGNSNGAGTVIAYNKVHDACGPGENAGIYPDNNTSGITIHHNLVTNVEYGVIANMPATDVNVYNNTLWGVTAAMCGPAGTGSFTNVNTENNLSNASGWYGSNVSNNRTQTANQFTNSAAGDYTLTANSSGSNMVQITSGQ